MTFDRAHFAFAAAEASGNRSQEISGLSASSDLRSYYLAPVRIVWQSATGVREAQRLLEAKPGQTMKPEKSRPCALIGKVKGGGSILLDFGVEVHGGIEVITRQESKDSGSKPRIHVRFGESASEAMSQLGDRKSGNTFSMRDVVETLPAHGSKRFGQTGFRFVRIDAMGSAVLLSQVRAVVRMRNLPQVGSFRSDDERLNRIWSVGAYTVQLNMQEYLWDGIKRDRKVWIGDARPEIAVIEAVFGASEVVPKSLDFARDDSPLPQWINGISSYSLWWVLIQEDWWLHTGDRAYLEGQRPYMHGLLKQLRASIDSEGHERLGGWRFLDWPTSPNQEAISAGLQALTVMALESGARLMKALGDAEAEQACLTAADRARTVIDTRHGSKAAASLQVLAGMIDAKKTANDLLRVGGPTGISTFYGYYMLQALGRAEETDVALDFIRTYWGGMLDRGATTFWEDFDLDWLKGTGRIDELTPRDQMDLHGDTGNYCYVGFQKSLAHGWAAGPTAWLSDYVLGVEILEPGATKVRIHPHLGSLHWVEGSYPTPKGPIRIRHERKADGSIQSTIQAPPGVTATLVKDS